LPGELTGKEEKCQEKTSLMGTRSGGLKAKGFDLVAPCPAAGLSWLALAYERAAAASEG
jgi:hypothetical protein